MKSTQPIVVKDLPSARRRQLEALRKIAVLLDSALVIPGTSIRFGLDPILGLMPGVGDILSTTLSSFPLFAGVLWGVPLPILGKMVVNMLVDSLVGTVPFIGDIFDVTYKANLRNIDLLESTLQESPLAPRSPSQIRGLLALVTLVTVLIAACVLIVVAAFIKLIFRLLA